MTRLFRALRVHVACCVGVFMGLGICQSGPSWGESPRGPALHPGAQRPEDIRQEIQKQAREGIVLLDTLLALEKPAIAQSRSQRPEDVRKGLFDAFGGIPRMQQWHMVATRLKQHKLNDEALQLLTKTLEVARWGGPAAQPLIADLLRTLAQFHMAPGGGARQMR